MHDLDLSFAGDFPGGSDGKVSVYNAGDPGSIPGSGRSLGEGNGNPLQYYSLENPMDRGAWWATVHGVTKNRTRLSNFTFTFAGDVHLDHLIKDVSFRLLFCPFVVNILWGGTFRLCKYSVLQ